MVSGRCWRRSWELNKTSTRGCFFLMLVLLGSPQLIAQTPPPEATEGAKSRPGPGGKAGGNFSRTKTVCRDCNEIGEAKVVRNDCFSPEEEVRLHGQSRN